MFKPKNEYDRLYAKDTKGNFRSLGMIFNPEKEELNIRRKTIKLTPRQLNYLKEKRRREGGTKEVFEHELGGHITVYYVKNKELFFNLNLDIANISRILYLATFMDWKSGQANLLVTRHQHKKVYPMTKQEMQSLLKLTDRSLRKFLTNVKENGLVYEVEGKFYLNPDYFNKGKNHFNKKGYTRLYINTVRQLYEQCTPRQHKQLSYLFKLMPKLYYDNNAIVHDSKEQDPNKLKYMDLKDICNFLGVSETNSTRLKNDLIKFKIVYDNVERSVFSYIKVENAHGKYDFFVVNPLVIYAGNDFDEANRIVQLSFFYDKHLK